MIDAPKMTPVGDSALLLEFANHIDRDTNRQVLALARQIQQEKLPGVLELVPSYRSLLLHYDCSQITLDTLRDKIQQASSHSEPSGEQRLWHIPVCYGGEAGCDLDEVARLHELSTDDVIRLHCAAEFRIYMIGFAPGWCYLGGLPDVLHTPRLPSPRLEVPAGCISIGGQQGMIGALPMPSGWRLLGQTAVRSYDPKREPAFLFQAGDEIRFHEVDASEFQRQQKASERGEIFLDPAVLPHTGAANG